MSKINCKKEIHVVFGILFIFGAILIGTTGVLNSVYGQVNYIANQTSTPAAAANSNATSTPAITSPTQTNSTANQTSTLAATTTNASTTATAKQEASNTIKGAINEAGQFLSNATQKLTSSKSAGALLNDTSDALGNAYVETKKFFSPN